MKKLAEMKSILAAIVLASLPGAALGQVDQHPWDTPDHRGLFIESEDGEKILRLYGSVRMLAVYDDKQNFHPFDLNIPQVPTGEDDVIDYNPASEKFENVVLPFGVGAAFKHNWTKSLSTTAAGAYMDVRNEPFESDNGAFDGLAFSDGFKGSTSPSTNGKGW